MKRKLKLKIYFDNDQEQLPITYRLKMLVREAVEAALDYEQYGNVCEVSVTFTNDKEIRALNKKFRNIDKSTDVLSFPLFEESADGTRELGDIVLSLERAEEQAENFGHSLQREVGYLTTHSMLHLLGYDHETGEEDEADMRARQRDVMARMGLTFQQSTDKQED